MAQDFNTQKKKYIHADVPFLKIDSLSIVPGSLFILDEKRDTLPPVFYVLNWENAELRFNIPDFLKNQTICIYYRTFSVNFSTPAGRPDSTQYQYDAPGLATIKMQQLIPSTADGLLRYQGLNSSGSITRGLSIGNNQGAIVNSQLNLKLFGQISEDIEIEAVISDENIPMQAEGNTYQLEEFDKVFITLKGKGAGITAGDYDLSFKKGHFLNYNRKAQGGRIAYEIPDADGGSVAGVYVSGAVAKGKYARNDIKGTEGNQGPYKLSGAENESYFIVLSGSEKVFIDGVLLTRGADNDYIIDYNLAEIVFTSKKIIHQNSRIIVEFEYVQQNYLRSMFSAGAQYKTKKSLTQINWYSEQDHKNRPLFRDLTARQKSILSNAGDLVENAYDSFIDSVAFSNDRILYCMVDTLGFDSVFVNSTNPEKAFYSLGFTLVGQGRGNYVPLNTSLNGKVYKWVAPLNNIPQGFYEPVILIVAPEKKQMLSMSSDFQLSENTNSGIELAVSNYDKNRFSDKGDSDNNAVSLFVFTNNKKDLNSKWVLNSMLFYEYQGASFETIDPYRDVEFARKWNIDSTIAKSPQHLPGLSLLFKNTGQAEIHFKSTGLIINELGYRALKNDLGIREKLGKTSLNYKGSWMKSGGTEWTSFYEHDALIEQDLTITRLGINHRMEHNIRKAGNIWSPGSDAFQEVTAFFRSPDSLKWNYRLYQAYRIDLKPEGSAFADDMKSIQSGIVLNAPSTLSHRFSVNASVRNVKPDSLGLLKHMLSGQVDHYLRLRKGFISSGFMVETIRGIERKREYTYVEVPVGQGAYSWNDYNGNQLMELNEFELSPFPDEANFIRIFIPSEVYVPTQSLTINHSLTIDPAVLFSERDGFARFLSLFYNQCSWRIDNKNMLVSGMSPFSMLMPLSSDSLLVYRNSQFRNTLFFNRASPIAAIDVTYFNTKNKNLMSYGFESVNTEMLQNRIRWSIIKPLVLNNQFSIRFKDNISDYFANRNYTINTLENEASLSYQKHTSYRISALYTFQVSENISGLLNEKAIINKAGAEFRIQSPGKGFMNARFQIQFINYPFEKNTPLAFDILQGLQNGTNYLWNLTWQRSLNSFLQLNLSYNGRKSPDVKMIHTGQVQLKAFF